ncbi:hypothetical protein [Methanobacterium sp.]|uniref:hypothetical protein n=1 Tax=Methanobacterium sp. TaxID=2164 RepID=UPI003C716D3D
MTEELREDLPKEDLLMIFDKDSNRTIFQKILVLLFNKTIFNSIILFIIVITAYYGIYSYYDYLNPIAALIAGSILTILLIIMRESYNSIKNKNNISLAFNNELMRNWNILRMNFRTLKQELNIVTEEQFIISIVYSIQLDICKLLVLNFPKKAINIDLMNINDYINDSNEINELIRNRENIRQHGFINAKQYHSALKVYDDQIITKTKGILEHILRLLELNGRLMKLDSTDIKYLMNKDNLEEFSKLNRLNKSRIENDIKSAHERNIQTLIIFDSKI